MKRLYILFTLSVILLVACRDEEGLPKACLGECTYYPGFLWSDADTSGVTKHLFLDFNKDAKDDAESFAEIEFVDKEGNPIPDNELEITIDGIVIKDNTFKVYSTETEKEVKFRYLPKAESGNHQGYIKLLSYKLDRYEDKELNGAPTEVMRWDLSFNKCMNPLAKVLMWICILMLALLLIWLLILRPILYPRFGSIQKTFNIPGMAPLIIRFKGARMVVLAASHPKKQSTWNRFWTGKILYKTHPAFVAPIVFKPKGGHQILSKIQAGTYQVMPNPMPGVGAATIIDIKKNLKINVN